MKESFFESASGERVAPVGGLAMLRETRLVLVVERRWLARCGQCGARAATFVSDFPPVDGPTPLGRTLCGAVYAPVRVECRRCDASPVEMVAWADPYQRQSRRLQQRLAVEAASMPVMHVAALHGLGWLTVRRAEEQGPRALGR